MISEILLGIADILLGVIAFRVVAPAGHPGTFIAEGQREDIWLGTFPHEPAPPPAASEVPVSDHLTEFARQEKYIDEYVAEHFERATSPEDEQHQRWEAQKHYNRTKR